MVVCDSDIWHLAGGLTCLPELVSTLLVNYSKDMILIITGILGPRNTVFKNAGVCH